MTSGAYGHTLGGAVGMGYVPGAPGESAAVMLSSRYQIDVAGRMVDAEARLRPLYDPTGARLHA